MKISIHNEWMIVFLIVIIYCFSSKLIEYKILYFGCSELDMSWYGRFFMHLAWSFSALHYFITSVLHNCLFDYFHGWVVNFFSPDMTSLTLSDFKDHHTADISEQLKLNSSSILFTLKKSYSKLILVGHELIWWIC